MKPTRAAILTAYALQRASHADKHVPTLRANIRAAMRRALTQAAAFIRKHGTLKINSAMRAPWAKDIWRALHGRMFYMASHGYQLAGKETAKGKSHGIGRILPASAGSRTLLGKASDGGFEVREDKSAFVQDTDWRGLDRWISTTAESASHTLGNRMLTIFETAAAYKDPETGRGHTPMDIAKQLMALGDDMTDQRATMLARTGAIFGYNEGAMQRYADDGVPVVQWLTAADDLACPICAEFNGKRVETKENFYDNGDEVTAGGMSMKFKFAIKHPPAHPNCRCTMIPIVDEGQLSGE